MDIENAMHIEGGDGPVASHNADAIEPVKSLVNTDMEELEDTTMSPSHHEPPFTGNESYNCSPTLESYLFTQTPAGSELCSWAVGPISSRNDLASPLVCEKVSRKLGKRPSHGKFRRKRKEETDLRRQNALRALAAEKELRTTERSRPHSSVLIIHFPDAEITSSLVAGFSNAIKEVVLPASVEPRYCLVHLKAEVDAECTIAEINQVRFGNGYLRAEVKHFTDEEQADFIDPLSLYISNIPFSMTTGDIRAKFPDAQRVDLSVIRKKNRARYAFVRYASADEAMDSYRKLRTTMWRNRPLTVRFRRLRKEIPFTQQLLPNSTSNTSGTEDDLNECQVISPPPVKSITISDSETSGSDTNSITTLKKKRKCTTNPDDIDEIRKLKTRMAEFEAIIKNLQGAQDIKAFPLLKKEPQPKQAASEHRPLSPNTLRTAIKMEQEYLGISDYSSANMSPYRPTTVANGSSKDRDRGLLNTMCFGQRKSTKPTSAAASEHSEFISKASGANETDRVRQLFAQLDSDSDA